MEICKESSSSMPLRQTFKSVWIPKNRTIRLELNLLDHHSKMKPNPILPALVGITPHCKVDSKLISKTSSQSPNIVLPQRYRKYDACSFVSNPTQSREKILNQLNKVSNQSILAKDRSNVLCSSIKCDSESSNQGESFFMYSNLSNDTLSAQTCDLKFSHQAGLSEKYCNNFSVLSSTLSRGAGGTFEKHCNRSNATSSAQNRSKLRSIQDGTFDKNRNCRFLNYSIQRQELESTELDGILGKNDNRRYVNYSAQRNQLESSNQDGTFEHDRNQRFPKLSVQRHGLESSAQVETTENRHSLNCSIQRHALESSNQDTSIGENDGDLVPVTSTRFQSNEGTNNLESWKKTSSFSDSGTSSSFGRKKSNRKRTKKKRIKAPDKTACRCRSCGLVLTSARQLQKHVDLHRPALLRTCGTCGKRFSRPDYLRDHAKVHRRRSGPHSCEKCGLQFTRRVYLDRHLPDCPGH